MLAANNYVTFARSDDADFVTRLYAAGALLVLDAEQAGGCSGLPPRRSAGHPRERSEAIHVSATSHSWIPSSLTVLAIDRQERNHQRYDAYF